MLYAFIVAAIGFAFFRIIKLLRKTKVTTHLISKSMDHTFDNSWTPLTLGDVVNDLRTIDTSVYSGQPLFMDLSGELTVAEKQAAFFFLTSIFCAARDCVEYPQDRPFTIYDPNHILDGFVETLSEYRVNLPIQGEKYIQRARDEGTFINFGKQQTDYFCIFNDQEKAKAHHEERTTTYAAPAELVLKSSQIDGDEIRALKRKVGHHPIALANDAAETSDRVFVASLAGYANTTESDGRDSKADKKTELDNLAGYVGKCIARANLVFLNGGPDPKDGPMREGPIAALKFGEKKEIDACYSLPILQQYFNPDNLSHLRDAQVNFFYAKTEQERLSCMLRRSTVSVILPGAIGTWYEALGALLSKKPVIFVNDRDNYWAPLVTCLKNAGLWQAHCHVTDLAGFADKLREVTSPVAQSAPAVTPGRDAAATPTLAQKEAQKPAPSPSLA